MKFKNLSRVERNMLTGLFCQFVTILLGFLMPRLYLTYYGSVSFTFKDNEFSTYNRKVHFTPIWYPDGSAYTVYTYIIDAWTPAGMLSVNVNDSIQIQGSLYDDWYSKRE